MEQSVWNIYHQFRCIAGRCTDSCCKDWEVDVDPESAAYYRGLSGNLGDRLRQVLQDTDEGTMMILEDGRCPMWRKDGLCQIQAAYGHDALCQVCREYPRLHMDYGDFVQWGLELSCPEAARLIFQGFKEEMCSVPGGTEPEYDPFVMEILKKSRVELERFWDTAPCSVPEKLAVTLLFSHQTQQAIDGGEYQFLDWQRCLHTAQSITGEGEIELLLQFFQELEILTEKWKNCLQLPNPGTWDDRLGYFAKYLICRYWYQAVWDYDLVCRGKWIVGACILVNTLGGDTQQTCQLFAKEIENDPDNRDAILDAAYTHPAFTDKNLLCLLK